MVTSAKNFQSIEIGDITPIHWNIKKRRIENKKNRVALMLKNSFFFFKKTMFLDK